MSRRFHATAAGASVLRPVSLLALGGLLAACADRPSPSSPDAPAPTAGQPSSIVINPGLVPKQIVFGAATYDGQHVFRINPNGTGQVQVTSASENLWGATPAWSPDRTRIAFSRTANGVVTLSAMKIDGTGRVSYGDGSNPRWSPDGTKIAYQRHVDGGPPQVFVINATGTGRQQLANHPYGSQMPTWSPDGSTIAYVAGSVGGSAGSTEIWVMNATGTDPHQITSCTSAGMKCLTPDWHPTPGDDRIAYSVSPSGNPVSQVRLIRADGSNDALVRSIPRYMPTKFPVWSPDGTRIAYVDKPRHQIEAEIFTMKADGSGAQQVTSMSFAKLGMDW